MSNPEQKSKAVYRYREARRLRLGDRVLLEGGGYLVVASIESAAEGGLILFDRSRTMSVSLKEGDVVRVEPRIRTA